MGPIRCIFFTSGLNPHVSAKEEPQIGLICRLSRSGNEAPGLILIHRIMSFCAFSMASECRLWSFSTGIDSPRWPISAQGKSKVLSGFVLARLWMRRWGEVAEIVLRCFFFSDVTFRSKWHLLWGFLCHAGRDLSAPFSPRMHLVAETLSLLISSLLVPEQQLL